MSDFSKTEGPTHIRRATPDDLPQLQTLLQTYFAEIGVQYVDSRADLHAYLTSRTLGFYVAETDKELVGCVLTRQLPCFPGGVECKRLYVLPAFRHHHLATQLMDAAEASALAHGATWVYLDSRRDLTAAIDLYLHRGYIECGRYNENPEASIFLKKSLAAEATAPQPESR
jgi:ribosomal protein S18 acetylase RimI-like enzyme